MDQYLPCGGKIVIDRPCGLAKCIGTIFVIQYHIIVEHFADAPLAVEQISEVINIQTDIQCVFMTGHIEIELLGKLEVDSVQPRDFASIAFGILTSVLAQITVARNVFLEGGLVLIGDEWHGSQFIHCGDVHQLRSTSHAAHIVDR